MAYGRNEGSGGGTNVVAAVILAVGLAMAGWFVAGGYVSARTADRHVTVKGLAERDVTADLAVWPITLTASGVDLAQAQTRIDEYLAATRLFLGERGFDEAEISLGRLRLEDRLAQGWSELPAEGRYLINQPLVVRSTNVDLVAEVSRQLGELVRQGVVVTGWEGPAYVFTRLNDIKPEMISEATAAARAAGEEFANDSGSRLGGIRTARQGIFEILPRDQIPGETESQQIFKRVRLVTTVTYLLE